MRIVTILLGAMIVLVVGCRSSEETRRTATGAPAMGEAVAGMDPLEKPAPHPNDVDRYDRKRVGEYEREKARHDAARERDRRIDEDPIEQPPRAPPEEEKPPR